jgi:hypothetical protein
MSDRNGVKESARNLKNQRLMAALAEVWIFLIVIVFLVIRVLGSNSAKHLIDAVKGR